MREAPDYKAIWEGRTGQPQPVTLHGRYRQLDPVHMVVTASGEVIRPPEKSFLIEEVAGRPRPFVIHTPSTYPTPAMRSDDLLFWHRGPLFC